MGWRRVDDMFDAHPKVIELEDLGARRFTSAMAVWLVGGCYAARNDGVVTSKFLRRRNLVAWQVAVDDLVTVRLLDPVSPGVWRFHDHTDYNLTSDEKLAKTKANTERQRRWRDKCRRVYSGSTALQRNAAPDPTPTPTPINPPNPPSGGTSTGSPQKDLFGNETKPNGKGKKRKPQFTKQANEVFTTWKDLHGTERSNYTDARKKRIVQRLREGYTVDQLMAALRGAFADPFLMGDNPRQTEYRGLQTILRDGDQVERLGALDGKPRARRPGMAPARKSEDFTPTDPDVVFGKRDDDDDSIEMKLPDGWGTGRRHGT